MPLHLLTSTYKQAKQTSRTHPSLKTPELHRSQLCPSNSNFARVGWQTRCFAINFAPNRDLLGCGAPTVTRRHVGFRLVFLLREKRCQIPAANRRKSYARARVFSTAKWSMRPTRNADHHNHLIGSYPIHYLIIHRINCCDWKPHYLDPFMLLPKCQNS